VIVAAYTCWSVPASVVRAGLRVRLVDIDPDSLDIPESALRDVAWSRVAAVVAPHLLDRTCDIDRICRFVKGSDSRVQIVEDAAQAWPAPNSALADAALLSFDRGKPLPLGGGGALLCREGVFAAGTFDRPGGFGSATRFMVSILLSDRRVFRLAASPPFLGVGKTVYDPAFLEARGLHAWQRRLGVRLLERLPALSASRRANAERLAALVRALPGWRIPGPAQFSGPIRLGVLAPDPATRSRVVADLRRDGIGASALYPGTLADIPELTPHLAGTTGNLPGAREVASRLMTLPVYPGLSQQELGRIGAAVEAAATSIGR
jgi:dTDP-4-amino-4,6-dideoxygalactose transaminase